LLSFLETEPIWSVHPEVLGVVVRQFDALLPNRMTVTNKPRTQAVVDGFQGLRIAVKRSLLQEGTAAEQSIVLGTILSSWPSIWKWSKYLYYTTDNGLATAFDAKSRPTYPSCSPFNSLYACFSRIRKQPFSVPSYPPPTSSKWSPRCGFGKQIVHAIARG